MQSLYRWWRLVIYQSPPWTHSEIVFPTPQLTKLEELSCPLTIQSDNSSKVRVPALCANMNCTQVRVDKYLRINVTAVNRTTNGPFSIGVVLTLTMMMHMVVK